MRVFHYVVTMGTSSSRLKVETFARNKEAAIKMAMAAYPGAPRSAVTAQRKAKRRR